MKMRSRSIPEARLTTDESQALRTVLTVLSLRSHTGEVGLMHGLDRFVSSQVILKKCDLDILDAAARKLGLGGGIKRNGT